MNDVRSTNCSRRVTLSVVFWVAFLSAVYIASVAELVSQAVPFGTDEAVYSFKARSIANGVDASQVWGDYRAPGLPAILSIFLTSGTSETIPRSLVAVFGLIAVLATWSIARGAFGMLAGAIAALGLICTPPFLAASVSALPDVPGAALVLLVMQIILLATRGGRLSWWSLSAVPLAIAATLVRFGAPLQLVGAGVVIIVLRWRELLLSKTLVVFLSASIALGTYGVLYLPDTLGTTESPASAIAELSALGPPQFLKVLWDYILSIDFLIGSPSAVVLGIGVSYGMARSLMGQTLGPEFLAFMLGAVILAVAIISLIHAEYRYLTPVWPFLWIAASGPLSHVLGILPKIEMRAVATTTAAFMLLSILKADDTNDSLRDKAAIRDAARELGKLSKTGSIGVVSSYAPEFAWYSGARVARFDVGDSRLDWVPEPKATPEDDFAKLTGANRVFVAVVQNGRTQPSSGTLEQYRARRVGLTYDFGRRLDGGRNYVEVFEVR